MSFFQLFQYCLGSGKRAIGDFSSEQLVHDPLILSRYIQIHILTCLVLKLDSKKQGLSGEEGKRRQIFTEWPSASNRGRDQLLR